MQTSQSLVQKSASAIIGDLIEDLEPDERSTHEKIIDYQELRKEELEARKEINDLIYEAVLN